MIIKNCLTCTVANSLHLADCLQRIFHERTLEFYAKAACFSHPTCNYQQKPGAIMATAVDPDVVMSCFAMSRGQSAL